VPVRQTGAGIACLLSERRRASPFLPFRRDLTNKAVPRSRRIEKLLWDGDHLNSHGHAGMSWTYLPLHRSSPLRAIILMRSRKIQISTATSSCASQAGVLSLNLYESSGAAAPRWVHQRQEGRRPAPKDKDPSRDVASRT
jgi:hypothetical protein